MTDEPAPIVRGRRVVALPRRETAFVRVAACGRCGLRLSRYNPGPWCNGCDEKHGRIRRPRIRGRRRDDP